MREYLLAMLNLPECNRQLIEEIINININDVLAPYVVDDSIIEFTDRLYNIIFALIDASSGFYRSLALFSFSADTLDNMIQNFFGNDLVGDNLSRFQRHVSNSRNESETLRNAVNQYIEGLNALIQTYPNNGVYTPIQFLNTYDFSGYMFRGINTNHTQVQYIIDSARGALQHITRIYSLITDGPNGLYNSSRVVENYTEIYNSMRNILTAHPQIEAAYLTFYDLAASLEFLISDFFRSRYNID